MRPARFRLVVFSLLPAALACGSGEAADLVLRHGTIYPSAGDSVTVEALAVRQGRIIYAGSDAGAEGYISNRTTVIELGGRMVLPGFHDTDMHLQGGIALLECTLDGLTTSQAILDSVGRYGAQHPVLPWIRGRGWQLPLFPAAGPRKEWLDSVVPGRPVYLGSADGHSAWVSSKALAIAGITKGTPDPANGRIERDTVTGEPTGTLRGSAAALVARHLPSRTQEDIRAGLLRALSLANGYGITTVHEAAAGRDLLEAYAGLDSAAKLTARVVAAIEVDPDGGPGQVDSLRAWRGRNTGEQFSPRAAKIFADGVTPGAMDSLVSALDAAGFQIHVHAIGDGAVRMALDAFDFARAHNGPRDARPIIAHLQLIDPADVPRLVALGVIASVQPLRAYPDDDIVTLIEPVLGPERAGRLYPIGSLARAGVHLAAGSDWPVSSMNPFEAIQVAITRRSAASAAGPAWIPEEVVDLSTMLQAYTTGGAYAAGEEASNGTLEVGKAADLIVLDRNLFRIPVTEIHAVKVLLTLLAGRVVWRDRSLQ